MEITLTESLLLLASFAVLLIGYGNRRAISARTSRIFVKDHLQGLRHRKQDKTMLVLRKRLSLLASMLTLGGLGALSASLAAILSVFELDIATKSAFVAGLVFGALSAIQAIRESLLSNRSHFEELDETISAHDPHYQGKH